jgi:light-regulated signal transduction histidine kinase (bacteriophytochrome)
LNTIVFEDVSHSCDDNPNIAPRWTRSFVRIVMEGVPASVEAAATLMPDLSACDREPIHIPGFIQPQGALLTIRPTDFVMIQASANLADILGLSAGMSLGRSLHDVLGRPLGELLGDRARLAMEDFISRDIYAPHEVLRLAGPDDTQLSMRAHRSGALICVEIEAVAAHKSDERSSATVAQWALGRIAQSTDQIDLCTQAARQLKILTGYDRVMVYRFDRDGHGEVVAEALEPTLPPYLGLHYPATDIPQQARQIFLQQRVRLIGDIHYRPVPILTHPTLHDGTPLDMTYSALRGVSPVHVEYLTNMGVRASFAAALTHSKTLWGLIVGHHGSPRWMDTEQRAAVDIIGQVMGSVLHGHDTAERDARQIAMGRTMLVIREHLANLAPLVDCLLAAQTELLQVVDADGATLRIGGRLHSIGRVPAPGDALDALAVLHAASGGKLLAVDDLALR